ncbi:ATP-binding cassette sub-family A member 3-like [Mizuhopecten yessoensis]|uniref:ATP-binding cassette sub-family A member 3 n=1 Tax=Mizuhopecten yessoensis TaxID=6573 RepID=A0A210QSG5_MIZYE|nr:ATP-binding cassette sub-family A member 3-like [Mizuhopecten yessoensis]XP_021350993.1 ATP-binding cassette sub-family A member 3-like [Mizuhopecten yessoensis]OWF51665.1 ATP-binding cassette sub-family A member 3 [Mizuhopecten yessoensis]
MGKAAQFLLLTWKNWTIQKRKKAVTIFEIILPVGFAALLVVIRSLVKTELISTDTIWPPFPLMENATSKRTEILFAPNQTAIINLMMDISQNVGPNFTVRGYDTAKEIEDYHATNDKNIWAAVVFNSTADYRTVLPPSVQYDLSVSKRTNDERWRTENSYPFFRTPWFRNDADDGGEPYYRETGFLLLQYLVDRAIIDQQAPGNNLSTFEFEMQRMPYPPVVKDFLLPTLQGNLPLFLMLGFILSSLQTIKNILYEKERRLKEAMKLMGLSSTVYWLSWFFKALVYLVIACAIYTILFAVKIGDKGSVLNNSDPSLVFVFLICYSTSIIAFCFMISTFFNKANTGANVGGILYFLLYFPYFFLANYYETMSRSEKLATCLIFNTGMALGVNTIGIYEGTGDGARWTNFYKPATVDDNFSLLDSMIMLLADSVLYLLVTWYVDNVHPGEYGVPQPWYFPVSKTYWCGARPPSENYNHEELPSVTNPEKFERDPSGLRVGIKISGLRKVFGSGTGKKVAVTNTTLNMYDGQITALLGHNGAGKTTTMSMLTGFIPPTKGTATVNGYDICTDILHVRQSLGMCPQHNILFDTLTVQEHLEFFAQLKGSEKRMIRQEVDDMISILELEPKRHSFSVTLSGGQKRKLSVGIALISGSKVVILDEPTSGMDPAARRQIWDILQKFRQGRTIVLSTHFMDEADLLGDRIAIMAEGVVKCCGSSLFLKKLYGAGYHLVVVKTKDCNVDELTKMIQTLIPTAVLESQISAELSYLLPFDQSAKFEELFEHIEKKSVELGISSFGTSATTMEEVFLKVGESSKEQDEDDSTEASPLSNGIFNPSYLHKGDENGYGSANHVGPEDVTTLNLKNVPTDNGPSVDRFVEFNLNLMKNTGVELSLQQFYGMFVKKAIHFWRNRIVTLVQLLIPVAFTILALVVAETVPKPGNEPSLLLDLVPFGSNSVVGYRSSNVSSNIVTTYKDTFNGYQTEEFLPTSSFIDELLVKAKAIGTATFNKRYIIGADFNYNASETTLKVTSFFNGETFHGPAITVAYTMNAILQFFTDSQHSITTHNSPFKETLEANSRSVAGATLGTGFTIAFTILFGMAFLSTSFIIFLIKERANGAKHLQKVSGVSNLAYWASSFSWDIINYLIPVLLIMAVFAAFQTEAYSGGGRLGYVFLLFLLYGIACLPFVYLLHYLFNVPATGMVVVTMLNIVTGLATTMAVFVLRFPFLGTLDVSNGLDWVFSVIIPHYCLGLGLMNIYTNYEYINSCNAINYKLTCLIPIINKNPCCQDTCADNCFSFTEEYLRWESPGIGKYLIFMVIQAIVYFLLIFLVESGMFNQLFYFLSGTAENSVGSSMVAMEEQEYGKEEEDSDVRNERRRVNNTPLETLMQTDSLIIKNLSRTYGNLKAVQNISIGVAPQECFGLLGQNGAGKTSTFKMLTGDQIVSRGNAYVNTYSIQDQIRSVQQNLGYCPQFDSLIEQMTGRETLTMYARLRGVQEHQIKPVVNELLDIMTLRQYADKNCAYYSGGNKRKLSTAMALIGDPPFVLLDEPTTGMDPGARRTLWNVLSKIRASGRTLVLTSHSMEECDALCTKIVIMVNGRFVCLGSPQHLKNKFGHGYTLIVRLGSDDDGNTASGDALKNYIIKTFQNADIFDGHQGYLHFQIPDADVPLARVFGAMERAKAQFNIEDYSVHQTTLEQVFLTFTRHQTAPKEKKKKKTCGCC